MPRPLSAPPFLTRLVGLSAWAVITVVSVPGALAVITVAFGRAQPCDRIDRGTRPGVYLVRLDSGPGEPVFPGTSASLGLLDTREGASGRCILWEAPAEGTCGPDHWFQMADVSPDAFMPVAPAEVEQLGLKRFQSGLSLALVAHQCRIDVQVVHLDGDRRPDILLRDRTRKDEYGSHTVSAYSVAGDLPTLRFGYTLARDVLSLAALWDVDLIQMKGQTVDSVFVFRPLKSFTVLRIGPSGATYAPVAPSVGHAFALWTLSARSMLEPALECPLLCFAYVLYLALGAMVLRSAWRGVCCRARRARVTG